MLNVIIAIIGAIIAYVIFYLIIKAAVRNGTIEAHQIMTAPKTESVSSSDKSKYVTRECPNCGRYHSNEDTKCPRCGHEYTDAKG